MTHTCGPSKCRVKAVISDLKRGTGASSYIYIIVLRWLCTLPHERKTKSAAVSIDSGSGSVLQFPPSDPLCSRGNGMKMIL